MGRTNDTPLGPLDIKRKPAGLHQDGEVKGLYLRVTDTGARGFLLRYMLDGRRRDMWLGSTRETTLAQARDDARAARRLLKEGTDPLVLRHQQQAANKRQAGLNEWTFKKAAEAVHETLKPGWKNEKHAEQWINTLTTYAFPKIGDRPVGEIAVADVLDVLKPIWNTKAETARRVRQRFDAVMKWAVAHGYATTNPVEAATTLLAKQRDTVEHHAAMPYAAVPAFLADLDKRTPSAGSLALQFVILTACRSGEVRGATWGEIDLQAKVWTIPAGRTKADREHRVPLSDAAVQMLSGLDRRDDDDLVFPGTKGKALSDMTLAAVLKRMKVDVTVHGFRSSFRDWCADNGVSRELAERALAHAVADKTEAAYNRTDQFEQRRPLMQAWAQFVTGKQKGNVVNLRGAA